METATWGDVGEQGHKLDRSKVSPSDSQPQNSTKTSCWMPRIFRKKSKVLMSITGLHYNISKVQGSGLYICHFWLRLNV